MTAPSLDPNAGAGDSAVAYAAYRWHYRDYPTIDGAKVSLSHILNSPESLLNPSKAALGACSTPFSRGHCGSGRVGPSCPARGWDRLPPPDGADGRQARFCVRGRAASAVAVFGSAADLWRRAISTLPPFCSCAFLIELVAGCTSHTGWEWPRPRCSAWRSLPMIELDRKRNIILTNTRLNRAASRCAHLRSRSG